MLGTKTMKIAVLTAIATVAFAGSAIAQENVGSSTYPIGDDVEVLADSIAVECPAGTPLLSYRLVPANAAADAAVTVTFINPDGDDVVASNRELEDTLLWPGAEVDADGAVTNWPGWQFVDGMWEQGDDGFAFARGSVDVRFEVGQASTTVTVTYPQDCGPGADDVAVVDDIVEDTEERSEPIAAVDDDGRDATVLGTTLSLPLTGAEVPVLIVLGLLLAVGGAVAVLVTRRRQTV